jgi:hypothetical protein
MGGEENVQDFGGETTRKRPVTRPRRRWEKRIRMDLREIGRGV